jgi:hypothetical protein
MDPITLHALIVVLSVIGFITGIILLIVSIVFTVKKRRSLPGVSLAVLYS